MPRPEKALLFDIDGTLADTDALHLQAFNLVLGPRGHVFDHAHYTRELQGFSTASISAVTSASLAGLLEFFRC